MAIIDDMSIIAISNLESSVKGVVGPTFIAAFRKCYQKHVYRVDEILASGDKQLI